jgi:hypothetical protein
MYWQHPRKSYATRRWAKRVFGNQHRNIKRFLVNYEAFVDGGHILDKCLVLASNEKEALLKAHNLVKSLHPKAENIAMNIEEEHGLE